MTKYSRLLRISALLAADSACAVLSTALIYWIRLDGLLLSPFDGRVIATYLLALCLGISILWLCHIYDLATRFLDVALLKLIAVACFIYWALFFFLVAALNLLGFEWVSKYVGLMQPLLFFLAIVACRVIAKALINNFNGIGRAKSLKTKKIFVYGTGLVARHFVESMQKDSDVYVVGFIDGDPSLWGRIVSGVYVFSLEQFISKVRNKKNTYELIIALPKENFDERRDLLNRLLNLQIKIRALEPPIVSEFGVATIGGVKELDLNDLINRESFKFDFDRVNLSLDGKIILITGAAGSIGSEISRQVLKASPSVVVLLDHSEHDLYKLEHELRFGWDAKISLHTVLGSIQDEVFIKRVIEKFNIQVIFHAAAYKHVPLLESNCINGIKNNVFGTISCVDAAIEKNVESFVLISTDKAVRPSSLMGASKRLAELYVQAVSKPEVRQVSSTKFSIVRFGNVLGSSGSVIPLFRSQIQAGGPITITSPDVTRFFMTIAEAVHLVLNAYSLGADGEVFVLDMGKPVRIIELAKRMVQFSGLTIKDADGPDGDIELKFIGLRPGEKLHEELWHGSGPLPTLHPMIFKAVEPFMELSILKKSLYSIRSVCDAGDESLAHLLVMNLMQEVSSAE